MKNFIQTIALALMDETGLMRVNETCVEQTMIFELTATKSDGGKVIQIHPAG